MPCVPLAILFLILNYDYFSMEVLMPAHVISGFTISSGKPKVGQLINSAWSFSDTCSFEVLSPEEAAQRMRAARDDSDSSAADEDVTGQSPIYKSESEKIAILSGWLGFFSLIHLQSFHPERKHEKDEGETSKTQEEWYIKDVMFLEDVKNVPVGTVLKVDGAYAAVKFPSKERNKSEDILNQSNPENILQECRLLRKDELQVRSCILAQVKTCIKHKPSFFCGVNCPLSAFIFVMHTVL